VNRGQEYARGRFGLAAAQNQCQDREGNQIERFILHHKMAVWVADAFVMLETCQVSQN